MIDLLHTAFARLAPAQAAAGSGEPYPFQQAVAEALLAGRRVVLRAPRGSGKGVAALFPWLAGRLHAFDFPPQLLHVLPPGALVHAVRERVQQAAHTLPELRVSVQTACDALDPFLLADAVITDAEQLLGAALHRPLGLHPSLGNMNAGALLGAYPVFDEFPALRCREALMVWLGLLRRYYPITRCLWTTATWPRALARHVATLLDADYIEDGGRDGGRRSWATRATLSPEGILRAHQGRTLVVCNTVRGAQTLYRALRHLLHGDATELLLLHPYQFAHDRVPIEARAADLFAAGSTANALLVTTACIEVGAQLSAELLITDPAPAEGLLHRAGQCARFPGETGRVLVARVGEVPTGETAEPTAERLLTLLADGPPVTAGEELAALDELWEHTPAEELPELLRDLPSAEACEASAAHALTGALQERLFTRVGVALHSTPEMVLDPFELERLALSHAALERSWRRWQALGSPGEWFALIPHWGESEQHTPSWTSVTEACELHAETQLVVLNADAVSYDPALGLEMTQGTGYGSARLPAQHTSWNPLDQHVESYQEHAARALAACEHHADWHRYTLRHLGARWDIPTVELERWLRLCILWHDAGKLTADWQRAAFRWQVEVMRRQVDFDPLARIDYQQSRDGRFPCPAHAEAGGMVLFRALAILLGGHPPLHKGTVMALCYHHGVRLAAEVDLTPHPEAWATLLHLADGVLDARTVSRIDHAGWALQPTPTADAPPWHDPDCLMAYSLLVRAIRLADREVALTRPFA
ncbi:MAG TPA: DEAD/DEAH box helicase [Armatimonadota bacterium]|jgi:CRISPR-associated endonuclease/helicase Cas3